MQRIEFEVGKKRAFKVLCLGSHCDDIEIGCGGTILKLIRKFENMVFRWVVLSADAKRAAEAYKSANQFLKGSKKKSVTIESFRDGFFPYVGSDIKEYFEYLKKEVSPDIIFTHYRHDLHQDHRLVSELTWNTFRDQLILEYETIKYDGDLGSPNFFVQLNESLCKKKINYMFKCFKSQAGKHWFTEDALLSIMRIRGIESRSPFKFAEGYYCRKMVF